LAWRWWNFPRPLQKRKAATIEMVQLLFSWFHIQGLPWGVAVMVWSRYSRGSSISGCIVTYWRLQVERLLGTASQFDICARRLFVGWLEEYPYFIIFRNPFVVSTAISIRYRSNGKAHE
jgi:hypothetical protein